MGQADIVTNSTFDGRLFKDDKAGQQIAMDMSNVPRALMGNFAPGTTASGVGFKVSKPGFDVRTTGDANLAFNSNFNSFKIVSSGTNAQSVASLAQDATNTSTVAHNLGFIPTAIVFLNGTGSGYLTANTYYPVPQAIPVKIGATYYPGVIFSFTVDSTNIYFTVTNLSAATPITTIGTANWKYYLLQETAN